MLKTPLIPKNKLFGDTEPKDFNNTVNYDSDEQNQTAKEGFIQKIKSLIPATKDP